MLYLIDFNCSYQMLDNYRYQFQTLGQAQQADFIASTILTVFSSHNNLKCLIFLLKGSSVIEHLICSKKERLILWKHLHIKVCC
jgi:hypothetical protein